MPLTPRDLASDPLHWSVYLVRCRDGSLYTGVSTDPARRIRIHNSGRGAAYTRSRRPVSLAYTETARDKGAALSREWTIKQLSRTEKEALIVSRTRLSKQQPAGAKFTGFHPGALTFFRGLRRHNSREWFEARRAVYETEVRAPFQALVEELDVRLAAFAPEIVGDPRRSIFRIHRDVRFSRDKSPYKTHAACWLYHRDAGRGVGGEVEGGAGFYFHLAPDECSLGGGIWMPPRPALGRIREALTQKQRAFERIVLAPAFRRRFGALDEEAMLKRLPRGYADTHPTARWLRYQSFTVGRTLTPSQCLGPRLVGLLERDYRMLTPLVRWLNSALGFPPANRR